MVEENKEEDFEAYIVQASGFDESIVKVVCSLIDDIKEKTKEEKNAKKLIVFVHIIDDSVIDDCRKCRIYKSFEEIINQKLKG